MHLSDEDPEALGDFLSNPRASLDVGMEALRLRMSGTDLFEVLLDDFEEIEDGDNPHGI